MLFFKIFQNIDEKGKNFGHLFESEKATILLGLRNSRKKNFNFPRKK